MKWTSHTSLLDSIKLRYQRNGHYDDRQTLIMLHGITDNGECFKRVAENLIDEYDIVLVDARGHGQSDAPVDGYYPTDMADDIIRLITVLGCYHPVLIGHSMGAYVASIVASTGRNFIKALVMEDPPLRTSQPTPNQLEATVNWWENRIRQDSKKTLETLREEGRINRRWADADIIPWAESKRRVNSQITGYIRGQATHDWRGTLRQIESPTLLITGDDRDNGAIVTPEIAEEVTRLIPSVTVRHIKNAGHSIRRDQFDLYMHALETFLRSLR